MHEKYNDEIVLFSFKHIVFIKPEQDVYHRKKANTV